MASEIATAYVRIQPTADGMQKNLENLLGGEADAAGKKSGGIFGSSFASSMAGAVQSASYKAQGILSNIMSTSVEFEAQMDKVRAITNADDNAFQALNETARELGRTTRYSASEVAQAMEYMGMAGWDTHEIISGLPGVLDLATSSGEDLATTSDIVTDALTAFNKEAGDSGRLADIMAAAATNSNTNVAMMGDTFKYAAALGGTMKFSMEDIALAMGLMANAGTKSSQAGTSLRNIMSRLAAPTDEVSIAMEKLGLKIDDGRGNMLSFRDIIEQLRQKIGGLTYDQSAYDAGVQELNRSLEAGIITQEEYDESLENLADSTLTAADAQKAQAAKALAGQYGLAGLLAIVNADDEAYSSLAEAIDTSSETMVKTTDGAIIPMSKALKEGKQWTEEFSGAAAAMSSVMDDNVAGRMKALQSRLEELALKAGEHLLPVAEKILDVAIKVADGFGSLPEPMQGVIAQGVALTAVAGPLINTFSGFAGIIGTVGTKVINLSSTAIPALSEAISASSVTITGALGAIGTAALGAADALLVAYDVKTLKDASETYDQAFKTHQNETETALSSYAQLYQDKGKEVADQWAGMVYQIDTTSMSMDQAQAALAEKIEGYWKDVPQNLWEGFASGWDYYFGKNGAGLFALAEDGFTGLINGVMGMLGIHSPSKVFEGIGENTMIGYARGIMRDTSVGRAFESVLSQTSGFIDSLGTTAESAITIGGNFMASLANGFISRANEAIQAASNIAGSIINTVRNIFQMHSPSHIGVAIGENFAGSMALGIEGEEKAVDRAINSLADSAIAQGEIMMTASSNAQAPASRGSNQANTQPGRNLTVILELNKAQLGRVVYNLNNEEVQRVGVNLAGGGIA